MACVRLTLQIKRGKLITLGFLVLLFVKNDLISLVIIGL